MARINTLTNFLTDVADSIRSKTGKSEAIACEDFDTEIESISGGGGEPNLQTKSVTITTNGTTTVTADTGYDGLDEVDITTNVPSSGGIQITNASYLFYNNARSDVFNELMAGLNNVTDCKSMFENSTISSSIVLNNGELNALNQTESFKNMFMNSRITSVVLTSTSTTPNTFYQMFSGNTTVTSVDLSGINLNRLTSISGASSMFLNCNSLVSVKFPTNMFLNTTDFNSFGSCFDRCHNLQTINDNSLQYFIEHFPLSDIPGSIFRGYNGSNMTNVVFKTLPDTVVGKIYDRAFQYCTNIIQFSANNITGIIGTSTSSGAFSFCYGLKAVWLGDKLTSADMGRVAFYRCDYLKKIYINLPRATVTAFANYNYAFMNNTNKTGIIVCNDDAGWMTKEEFDAIDWSTYTE